MSAITALWVISTVDVPSSPWIRSIASSTSTPVWLSSAPVGSSQSRMSGRFAIARAMATRCCSPPESWAGKWFSRSPSPTSRSASSRLHRVRGYLGHERHVLERGQARDQVVELEHEPDVLAPVLRQPRVVQSRQLVVEEPGLAAARGVEAPEDVEQRGLAAARRDRAARRARSSRARGRGRAARALRRLRCGRPWSAPAHEGWESGRPWGNHGPVAQDPEVAVVRMPLIRRAASRCEWRRWSRARAGRIRLPASKRCGPRRGDPRSRRLAP